MAAHSEVARMRVFIDTNILLDIYHLSGADLDELAKLVDLVKSGKVTLLVPQQVMDEFWRNREGVIADALKRFRESKAQATIPNVLRSYPSALKLRQAVDAVNEMVRDLTLQVTADIHSNALKADQIISELFSSSEVHTVPEPVVSRARLRVDLGNPPGKKGSMGDAINWEWLIQSQVPDGVREIVIVSGDGDFESELSKGELREFLLREWNERHPSCLLSLDKSLTDFLKREFPAIQLADETEKLAAIERLEKAWSFTATHRAIEQLSIYDDFKDQEVERILRAYVENRQVYWILGDEDVHSFALKIKSLAKTDATRDLAKKLDELVAQFSGENGS
jgi:predicted nucleic acid-binding protein